MDLTLALIGAGWLAIALVLVSGAAVSLYRLFSIPGPLPFFVMLERRGLNALQLEAAVGAGGVARALRRCALCAGRRDCGGHRVECPNEALIRYVTRLAPGLPEPRAFSGTKAALKA
jgi:hypothetical protein